MAPATRYLELSLLPGSFAISRLAADSPIPAWATQGPFFSVTRTGDELSVVTELSVVPLGVQSERGWRVLRVHGPFVLSEIGILDRKSTRPNSSHLVISYAVFCLKKKKTSISQSSTLR